MSLKQILNSISVLNNKQNFNGSLQDPQSVNVNNTSISHSLNNKNTNQNSPNIKAKSSPIKNIGDKSQITRLKIKLADRQFQLKKLQQDCNLKIALIQRQLTRQKNQKKQFFRQHKQKLQQQARYFQSKIKCQQDQFNRNLKSQQDRIRQAIMKEAQQSKRETMLKCQQQIHEKDKQISEINQLLQATTTELGVMHKQKLSVLRQSHSTQLHQLHLEQYKQLELIRQKHSSETAFYRQLQESKSKEFSLVEKILTDKIRQTQARLTEVTLKQKNTSNLLNEITIEISTIKKEKEQLRLDKIWLERKISKLETQYSEKFTLQLSQAKKSYQSKLAEQVTTFQAKLKDVLQTHQQSIKSNNYQMHLLQQRCQQLACLSTTLVPNQENLKKIQYLQFQLIKKQLQNQKQREDLRICKLELSNMDIIYQKMFEQAKIKSLKHKKLPTLLNRSTMECYNGATIPSLHANSKQNKKFNIRDIKNTSPEIKQELYYHSVPKFKENISVAIEEKNS